MCTHVSLSLHVCLYKFVYSYLYVFEPVHTCLCMCMHNCRYTSMGCMCACASKPDETYGRSLRVQVWSQTGLGLSFSTGKWADFCWIQGLMYREATDYQKMSVYSPCYGLWSWQLSSLLILKANPRLSLSSTIFCHSKIIEAKMSNHTEMCEVEWKFHHGHGCGRVLLRVHGSHDVPRRHSWEKQELWQGQSPTPCSQVGLHRNAMEGETFGPRNDISRALFTVL